MVNNKVFVFNKESKENGELYGSIKLEITNLIKHKVNAEVSPSQIVLKDELNKIGTFKALINFHSEVKANISIKIDKIEANNFSTAKQKWCVTFFFNTSSFQLLYFCGKN